MNVIVVCMDTLRWDALGCYGSDWVKTPCIDAFAESAALCSGAYCASFPTVPMRVDAYTGEVNWPRYGWRGPDPEQPKLPQLLRDAGVYTGLVLDTANNVHGPKLHEFYDEYHLIRKDVDDGITPEDIIMPVPEEYFRQFARGYRRDRSNWAHYRHESDWFVARTMMRASPAHYPQVVRDEGRAAPFLDRDAFGTGRPGRWGARRPALRRHGEPQPMRHSEMWSSS